MPAAAVKKSNKPVKSGIPKVIERKVRSAVRAHMGVIKSISGSMNGDDLVVTVEPTEVDKAKLKLVASELDDSLNKWDVSGSAISGTSITLTLSPIAVEEEEDEAEEEVEAEPVAAKPKKKKVRAEPAEEDEE